MLLIIAQVAVTVAVNSPQLAQIRRSTKTSPCLYTTGYGAWQAFYTTARLADGHAQGTGLQSPLIAATTCAKTDSLANRSTAVLPLPSTKAEGRFSSASKRRPWNVTAKVKVIIP